MYQIRVTAPDGSVTTHNFTGAQLTVGRDTSNDITVGEAASSQHCYFELGPNGCAVIERGSRNGTWVNGQRITAPVLLSASDRVYIGSFLFEAVQAAPVQRPAAPVAQPTHTGPILRTPGPNRKWRDMHGRLERYAEEWDAKQQVNNLALHGPELKAAIAWLKDAQNAQVPVTRLQREFIEASVRVGKGRAVRRALGWAGATLALGGLVTATIVLWPENLGSDDGDDSDDAALAADTAASEDSDGSESTSPRPSGFGEIDNAPPGLDDLEGDLEPGNVNAEIKHKVIPFETLSDIASRYGVALEDVAASNFLNPDAKSLPEGSEVVVSGAAQRPLPQQKIDYSLEPGEQEWLILAKRFGVPVTRLQAYNPEVKLEPNTTIVVWIDPKPYKPREPQRAIPKRTVNKYALSIGAPNNGRLEDGVQMPPSPLYIQAKAYLQYGSGQTIATLQEAIATFRNDVDYEGELILSDISKRRGGKNKPHKSHQSGRDIDIWLPTLRGVYKKKYTNERVKPRRPIWHEVDWYALWGLVRALIRTGKVQAIFLDWRYQEFVYRAAVNMGATEDELDEWIQWPRPKRSGKGIFRHSKDHLSHIHVRFKCAKWEDQCSNRATSLP